MTSHYEIVRPVNPKKSLRNGHGGEQSYLPICREEECARGGEGREAVEVIWCDEEDR